MEINYYQKYLKYKSKYLQAKDELYGGTVLKSKKSKDNDVIISIDVEKGKKKNFKVEVKTYQKRGKTNLFMVLIINLQKLKKMEKMENNILMNK